MVRATKPNIPFKNDGNYCYPTDINALDTSIDAIIDDYYSKSENINFPYSYLIKKNGSNYEAYDSNGTLAFSGIDSTIILQESIDALPLTGMGTIYLPEVYPINDTLIIPASAEGLTLKGANRYASRLVLADGADCDMLDATAYGITYFTCQDLGFDGNYTNQTSTSLMGLHLKAWQTRIQNCLIQNVNGTGIRTDPNISDEYIEGCIFATNLDGVSLGSSDSWIQNCMFHGNVNRGVILGAGGQTLIGSHVWGSLQNIVVDVGGPISIIGNEIETATYNNIYLYPSWGDIIGVTISGNHFFTGGTYPDPSTYIMMNDALSSGYYVKNVVVSGNIFDARPADGIVKVDGGVFNLGITIKDNTVIGAGARNPFPVSAGSTVFIGYNDGCYPILGDSTIEATVSSNRSAVTYGYIFGLAQPTMFTSMSFYASVRNAPHVAMGIYRQSDSKLMATTADTTLSTAAAGWITIDLADKTLLMPGNYFIILSIGGDWGTPNDLSFYCNTGIGTQITRTDGTYTYPMPDPFGAYSMGVGQMSIYATGIYFG